MKNPSLYFFLLLLLLSLSLAAQRENIIYPQEFATIFQDVHVDGNDLGYAVGTCGIVSRTTNGKDFDLVNSPNLEFYAVTCPNDDCGTVVAAGEGFIARRVGNGSWVTTDIDENETIRHLTDLGNDVVLAEGELKTYYRSTDRGANWTAITHTEFLSSSWTFVNGTTGYFIDGAENIQKTTDAGATFSSVGTSPASGSVLHFHDEMNGWLHRGTNGVLRTTDGGVTWTDLNVATTGRGMIFLDSYSPTHLVGVGIVNEIWESTDAGVTWVRTFIEAGEGTRPSFYNYHRRGDEWWVPNFNSEIVYFPAGLANDYQNVFLEERERLDEIRFLDRDFGITAGPRGLLLKTTDGGANWTAFNTMPRNVNAPVYNLDLRSREEIVIYYGNMRPRISKDGGQTFTNYIPESVDIPDGDQFYTDANGRLYVIGDEKYAFTTDDGANWTIGTHSLNTQMQGMSFPTDDTGYVVGRDLVAKTTDGGLNWTKLDLPRAGARVNDVFFFDADNGVVAVSSWGAYTTNDGGQTWQEGQLETGRTFQQFAYDADRDFLYGNSYGDNQSGLVEVSLDRGKTWQLIYSSCQTNTNLQLTPNGEEMYLLGRGMISRIDPARLTGTRSFARSSVRLKAYPNPSSGRVQVELPATNSPSQLSVFTADGRSLRSISLAAGEALREVDLSGQPAGMYTLRWVSPVGVMHVGRIILR